jgi:hypothetical protein
LGKIDYVKHNAKNLSSRPYMADGCYVGAYFSFSIEIIDVLSFEKICGEDDTEEHGK